MNKSSEFSPFPEKEVEIFWEKNVWMFHDIFDGGKQKPFVTGDSGLIDLLIKGIRRPKENKVILTLSDAPIIRKVGGIDGGILWDGFGPVGEKLNFVRERIIRSVLK